MKIDEYDFLTICKLDTGLLCEHTPLIWQKSRLFCSSTLSFLLRTTFPIMHSMVSVWQLGNVVKVTIWNTFQEGQTDVIFFIVFLHINRAWWKCQWCVDHGCQGGQWAKGGVEILIGTTGTTMHFGHRRSSAHIRLTRYLWWKKDFVKLQRCQSRLWQRKWQRSNSKTSPPAKTWRLNPRWHQRQRARASAGTTRTRPVSLPLPPLQRSHPPKPGKAAWACSPRTPRRCRRRRLWSARTRSRTAERLLSTVTVPSPRLRGWKRWAFFSVTARLYPGCEWTTTTKHLAAMKAPSESWHIVWRC